MAAGVNPRGVIVPLESSLESPDSIALVWESHLEAISVSPFVPSHPPILPTSTLLSRPSLTSTVRHERHDIYRLIGTRYSAISTSSITSPRSSPTTSYQPINIIPLASRRTTATHTRDAGVLLELLDRSEQSAVSARLSRTGHGDFWSQKEVSSGSWQGSSQD